MDDLKRSLYRAAPPHARTPSKESYRDSFSGATAGSPWTGRLPERTYSPAHYMPSSSTFSDLLDPEAPRPAPPAAQPRDYLAPSSKVMVVDALPLRSDTSEVDAISRMMNSPARVIRHTTTSSSPPKAAAATTAIRTDFPMFASATTAAGPSFDTFKGARQALFSDTSDADSRLADTLRSAATDTRPSQLTASNLAALNDKSKSSPPRTFSSFLPNAKDRLASPTPSDASSTSSVGSATSSASKKAASKGRVVASRFMQAPTVKQTPTKKPTATASSAATPVSKRTAATTSSAAATPVSKRTTATGSSSVQSTPTMVRKASATTISSAARTGTAAAAASTAMTPVQARTQSAAAARHAPVAMTPLQARLQAAREAHGLATPSRSVAATPTHAAAVSRSTVSSAVKAPITRERTSSVSSSATAASIRREATRPALARSGSTASLATRATSAAAATASRTVGTATTASTTSRAASMAAAAVAAKSAGVTGAGEEVRKAAPATIAPSHVLESSVATQHQLLSATMLQWCYLNARADHAFATQESTALRTLQAAWQHVESQERSLSRLRERHFLATHQAKLDTVLQVLLQGLETLERSMGSLEQYYRQLAESLQATMHRMPAIGINTAQDLGLVVRALQDSEQLLDEIERHTAEKDETTQTFADALGQLHSALEAERAELLRCHGSLAAATSLETLERSLRIQNIQCSS